MRINSRLTQIILLLSVAAVCSHAAVIFDNTTTDQQFSAFYSSGLTLIGDRVNLLSSSKLTSLSTQFFNAGSDATFDATLWFYGVGSPVGNQIGGSFAATGISIASNTSLTVTFADLENILVPQDLIVVFSVQNVSAGGDIGVNFFDPPTVGTSDNSFFIANGGTGFAQASTLIGVDNLYLEINGVPEPSTTGLALAGLMLIAVACKRPFSNR